MPKENEKLLHTEIAFAVLKIGKILCTNQSVPGAKILIHYQKKS